MSEEQMFAAITRVLLGRFNAPAIVDWLGQPNKFIDGHTPAWEIVYGDMAHVYTLLGFIERYTSSSMN